MSDLQNAISKILSDERLPTVLTFVSCTGVVVTAVMAVRATPKAVLILDQLKNDHERQEDCRDHIPPLEVLKHTWKLYAPAVGVGVITIAAIVTMNRVSQRNAAMLSAGAALATSSLKEYQQHVFDEIGMEKESKIRDKMAKHALAEMPPPEGPTADVYVFGAGETMVLDTMSGRYFKGSVEEIRAIENDVNKMIMQHNSVTLNEVYYRLGLDPIELGEMVGFDTDNMVDFHFSGQVGPNKQPVLVLGYINIPGNTR